jgi:outer membrane translocation and assembly module TamA
MQLVYQEDKLDFDALVKMAKEDPEQFERYRQQQIEDAIVNSSPEMQPRLRAQQSHIDRVIQSCNNPNQVNVKLYGELQKQLKKLNHAFSQLQNDHPTQPSLSAKVLPFSRN